MTTLASPFGIVFLVAGVALTATSDSHRTDVAETAEPSGADRASMPASALEAVVEGQRRTDRPPPTGGGASRGLRSPL